MSKQSSGLSQAKTGPVVFRVPGKPVPQGSMRAFTRKGGGVGMTPTNEGLLKTWRQDVGFHARMAGAYLMKGAVRVEIAFTLPRPRSHFGTGRNAGKVKPSAPRYPTTKPDTDKLIRAVLDALTYVCFTDDAQVTMITATKEYTIDSPETFIRVLPLEARANA